MSFSDEQPEINKIQPGQVLSPVVKHISQEKINLYAGASGDFNPIHIDEAFARQTPFGGTIAHGMLCLAYVSEMMVAAFGKSWASGGRLSIRFKAPARPGDTITASGKYLSTDSEEGGQYATCSLEAHNQKGETVVVGEARVRLG
jgi:3-hydroxybutyryl-CoA dehydratase